MICSPARWEVKGGAQGRYLETGTKAETAGNEAYLHVCRGFFGLLFYLALGHQPGRLDTAYRGLGLSTSIICHKNDQQTCQ